MFNPNDPRQLSKLKTAITGSLGEMKDFADQRLEAYKQYVGKHYKNGTQARVPLPMIAQAVGVILRSLVSSEPQALVATRRPEQRAPGHGFQLALNRTLREMHFGRSMRTWCFEAMMSPFGVMKVALDVSDVQEVEGMQVWSGKPMAEPVLFDDWVHDMSARRIDSIGFCGNRYAVSKEEALTSGIYDPEVVQRIARSEKIESTSSQNLSRDNKRFEEDYREMIELWDIWLPDEGQVVTITREHEDLPPLRVVDWNGPPAGPFHFLWFDEVPGNTMPLPPVALWRDIHELANQLFNKLARQALRQKKMVTVDDSAIKDGKLIVAGADGEAIVTNDADSIKEVSYGGIDQQNFGFVLQLKQLHSYYAGNTDALGGLAPMSGTVGQDELLSQAASERVKAMQENVDSETASILRGVAHYLLSDPWNEVPIEKRVAGTSQVVQTTWSPSQIENPWDYEVDLVPYSLRRKSPEERLGVVNSFMQSLMAALPVMQAQGIAPNMEAYIKMVAQLANMPELNDLVTYMEGETMLGAEDAQPPSTTTRRYVRDNRTTKTPQGQEQQLIAKLMSGTQQGAA